MTQKRAKSQVFGVVLAVLLMMTSILTACKSEAPSNTETTAPPVSGTDAPTTTSAPQEPTLAPSPSAPVPSESAEPSATSEPTPTPSHIPVSTLSPEDAEWVGRYDEVLSQYKDVMGLDARERNTHLGFTLEDLGNYVNENVMMSRFPGWTIYYALYDIDSNGVPELIIKGGPAEDMSQYDPAPYTYETQYDIFTYKDGDVIDVFQDNYIDVHIGNPDFGFQFYFTLQDNGVIAVYASVGTGFWIEEFYRLSSDGYAEFMEGVFCSQISGDDPVLYRRYTDLADTYDINNPEMTEDECYDLIIKYVDSDTTVLPVHKLLQRENGVMLNWMPLIG